VSTCRNSEAQCSMHGSSKLAYGMLQLARLFTPAGGPPTTVAVSRATLNIYIYIYINRGVL